LSTPYAVAKGGWLSLTLLLAFALICCYTAILLRQCLDSDPCICSYPDVGEASFGRWGRWTISVLLYLELYAVAIEFLILEGDNLAQLFPSADVTLGGLIVNPREVFVVLSAVCMLPTVWLRELNVLSYISAFGVVASFLMVVTVGWIGLLDGVGFHQQGGALIHWDALPVAVGLYSFCFCGHAVFPSIYGSMHNKTRFSHVRIFPQH
jgi:vesicular inhibitory amino acid transporter